LIACLFNNDAQRVAAKNSAWFYVIVNATPDSVALVLAACYAFALLFLSCFVCPFASVLVRWLGSSFAVFC
jgi:hypothetical protein